MEENNYNNYNTDNNNSYNANNADNNGNYNSYNANNGGYTQNNSPRKANGQSLASLILGSVALGLQVICCCDNNWAHCQGECRWNAWSSIWIF